MEREIDYFVSTGVMTPVFRQLIGLSIKYVMKKIGL